jgi:hypothetical protein
MKVRTLLYWLLAISLTPICVEAKLPKRAGPKPPATPAGKASAPAPAGRIVGRLTADGPVTVNGNRALSGDTIFSGAQIRTSADLGATVRLGALGQIEIAPGTSLTLNFDRTSIQGTISVGCAMLTTAPEVEGALTLPRGITKRTDSDRGTPVRACTDELGDEMETAGARFGNPGIDLGGNSIGFMEVANLLASSTAMVFGIGAIRPAVQNAVGGGNCGGCKTCCCCCNPSPSSP